jgi:FHA domain/Tetratricopeptide repeat
MRERVLGPEHPDTLRTRADLAFWIGESGDAAQALRLFQELLPDLERVLGPDHPDTLATRGSIAASIGESGDLSSDSLELYARTAYEAHRAASPGPIPTWEDSTEQEKQAWRSATSAVVGQSGDDIAEEVDTKSLLIQVGDQQHDFHSEFTVGRNGTLVISDEFASSHHARFTTALGLWYVEDLGSVNGTRLNGRRIRTRQRLKKGDKIRIGKTNMTVVSV